MKPGTKFLAWSALGVANTLNAKRPFDRKGYGSLPSFLAGWPTSDLPLVAIGAQAAGVALAGRRGALRSGMGKLGLALTALSWSELWRIHRRMDGAEAIARQALVDEFGADYLDRCATPVEEARGEQRPWKVPSPRVRKRYVANGNLAYGDAGRRNHVDVWARPDLPADRKAPVLIQIHGGGWVLGDKEGQAYPLLSHLAERGWVCVSASYRLSPRATWPDHIVDVKRAIAWVKDNIADYGGNPEWVAITGGSAGGHLSSLAALTPNDPDFQPGFEDADTSVQAAVPFYGVYDWTNRDELGNQHMQQFLADRVVKRPLTDQAVYESASPMCRVNAEAPPFFLLHGANDSLVPVEQARHFVDLLRKESSAPVAYAEFPHAQHAFEVFHNQRTVAAVHAVEQFLDVVRHDGFAHQPGS